MRDIIFRGKRIDNGEWIHGCLSHDKTPNNTYAFIDGEFKGVQRVESETVGQFTGVHDKNLIKIFEKDIVKRCYGVTYSTKQYPSFTDNTAIEEIAVIEYEHAGYDFLQLPPDPNFDVTFEVIGNIHDNPELLEAV